MSIPLDRLYNFLDSVVDHKLVIYGWNPHGSSSLKDFGPLKEIPILWHEKKTYFSVIFHDQEPLDYDFIQYQIDCQFCDLISHKDDFDLRSAPLLIEFYKKMHIRSLMLDTFYDLTLIVHSEKNSNQLTKFEQNNFVPVYFWSHAIIARDWFRFAEHDSLFAKKSVNPKTFLIYNRAWAGTREYRLKFMEQLINSNLNQDCITSFSEFENNLHYTQTEFKNKNFKINRFDFEKILPKNNHESIASADYNGIDYQNSLIEIVLETLFDDTRNHLTEKSLRPIACKQPFILVSTPGSLQYLRDYGFKTFDKFINEEYDTIQDSKSRLDLIIQEMQRISNLSSQQKHQLIQDMESIVDHNQKLFFSKDFQEKLITEFQINLDNAIAKVKTGPIKVNWDHARTVTKEHYPKIYSRTLPSIDNLAWADQWIRSQSKV
jgi:hypothetical protein